MTTTHVFIVNKDTFRYHLNYKFAGTSCSLEEIDFNNSKNTKFGKSEIGGVSLIADLSRIKSGDFIIFYLQQHDRQEGKFFGIFQAVNEGFIDPTGEYLEADLDKKLFCRILIKPFEVYQNGVTEWNALDNIKNIQSPFQMLWSLIYRKLKGNRGNTMITIYESERLFNLIRNNNVKLNGNNFSFDNEKIIEISSNYNYSGRQDKINILPRLLEKNRKHQIFEAHLQAYLLQNIDKDEVLKNIITDNQALNWIGNEVSCGVGMQKMDIVLEIENNHNKKTVVPIELKAVKYYSGIQNQIQRYVDWLLQYYKPNRECFIQPIIICKKSDILDIKHEFKLFNENNKNNFCMPLKYIEFDITDDKITFELVNYDA